MTPEQKDTVFRSLCRRPDVRRAALEAGVEALDVFLAAEEDEDFAQRLNKAMRVGTSLVESELLAQALSEHERPVMYKGQPVMRIDPITGESVPLMEKVAFSKATMDWLKAFKPDVFGDKLQVGVSGTVTLETKVPAAADLDDLQEELDRVRANKHAAEGTED